MYDTMVHFFIVTSLAAARADLIDGDQVFLVQLHTVSPTEASPRPVMVSFGADARRWRSAGLFQAPPPAGGTSRPA